MVRIYFFVEKEYHSLDKFKILLWERKTFKPKSPGDPYNRPHRGYFFIAIFSYMRLSHVLSALTKS